MIIVKLIAVPVVVWLASYVGRRWGHRLSGVISGFPLISGPIILFLAFEAPRAFTAETAWITMAVAPSVGVHCLTYAWLARLPLPRAWHWLACILGAWTMWFIAAWFMSAHVIAGPIGALIAVGEMLLAAALMPRVHSAPAAARIPTGEITVRMLVAVAIAAVIILGAERFGPRFSGILLGFPITASVLPLFTLYLYGADAVVRLLSGFLSGLVGFVCFFAAFASAVAPLGPWPAFMAGVLASAVAASLMLGIGSLRVKLRS